MDEALLKQIQEWTNKVPLIILGSGASVSFGIPTMLQLGVHLKNSISFVDADKQKQFDEFKSAFEKTQDLETSLSNIQLTAEVLNTIVSATWHLINRKDLECYDGLMQRKESMPLSELITYLIDTAQKKLTIVTTNYDRIAEYAASMANAFICTGFLNNYYGQFSNAVHNNNFSKISGMSGQVNLWKVHGSLDWFKSTKDDSDYHFPLRKCIPNNYIPSIVTPGISKHQKTHFEPYRTILTESDNSIQQATAFLCIGYGFNDEHVQPKLISQIKNGKPIIVITKQLTETTKKAIIDNKCKQYILLEEANDHDTRIYSSKFALEGEKIIDGQSYWQLDEYLKLING
jgi:NAD-dependent SIR2 family protein deacetylase